MSHHKRHTTHSIQIPIALLFAILMPAIANAVTTKPPPPPANVSTASNSHNHRTNNNNASAAQCDSRFSGRCLCGMADYEHQRRYVVNCTDTGFTGTEMLAHMPRQTEVLIFTGNRIGEVPPNVIGTINDYPRLAIIDMSNNHIREIRGKAYHHVASVEMLILNHNNLSIAAYSPDDSDNGDDDEFNHHHPRVFSNFFNLRSLHLTNAFADNTSAALSRDLHDIFVNSNLTKLMKLHLEQNEIRHFADRDVFCELPALRELYLADNLLDTVAFNVLCLRQLHFVNLAENRFEAVQPRDLAVFDRLQAMPARVTDLIVDWKGNPFGCDCRLQPLLDWMRRTNVTVRYREQLQCRHRREAVLAVGGRARAASATNDGPLEFLEDYHVPECALFSAARPAAGHVVALAVFLGAFCALLLTLLAAVLWMSRVRIRQWARPMMSSVSKKVQYTTITNEDQQRCEEVHV